MARSYGPWTKFLLCAKSPQVCSYADISAQVSDKDVLWLMWIQSNKKNEQ